MWRQVCDNAPKPKEGDDPYIRKSHRKDCHCTFSDDEGGGGRGGEGKPAKKRKKKKKKKRGGDEDEDPPTRKCKNPVRHDLESFAYYLTNHDVAAVTACKQALLISV